MLNSLTSASGQRTYGMTAKVLWDVVRHAAAAAGFNNLAPHDLRRTCATGHLAGGELDQIQFLLGHISIQTTERLPRVQAEASVRGERPPGHRA